MEGIWGKLVLGFTLNWPRYVRKRFGSGMFVRSWVSLFVYFLSIYVQCWFLYDAGGCLSSCPPVWGIEIARD